MGQRDEMADEYGGVDDENAQQEVVVLRLQDEKNDGEKRDGEEEFVNHLRAQFVLASLP